MNVQLSSKSNEWYTPGYIIDLVGYVLGDIDLDPASCEYANRYVQAKRILTIEDDALSVAWASEPVSVFLNPPGGKVKNKSQSAMFWQRLIDLRNQGNLKHAIYMGFSLEQIAVTQGCTQSLGNYPICIPRKRIRFVSPEGKRNSPSHSNVIAYVPGSIDETDLFKKVFVDLGVILNPEHPG